MTTPAGDSRREVAPALLHALLCYVERAAGREVLDRVVATSPIRIDDLQDERRWFSADEVLAVADVAASICHDRNIGRAAGIELWRMLCVKPGYLDLVRSAGSVTEAITAAAGRASKISTGRSNAVSWTGTGALTLIAQYADASIGHPFFCGISVGFYSQVPAAFGLTGDAVEVECQLEGADRCVYRVTWFEDSGLARLDETAISDSASRAQAQLHQLEQIHTLTAELLGADKVDEVLARITLEAGHAVQAPRYLLAVRVNDSDQLRVHHRGFRAGTAAAFADRLLAGSVGEADGVLVADIAMRDRHYGRLAACYPRGSTFASIDRRMLAAYAGHAAAVLKHVASLESAANDRDTATTLLRLAHRLADATTEADVIQRVVQAIPQVTHSEAASLWTWEPTLEELQHAASADFSETGELRAPHRLDAEELAVLRRLAANPQPQLLRAAELSAPARRALGLSGVSSAAVMPIAIQGTFSGIICASFIGKLPDSELLLTRLAGLADHAALALQSVRLLEQTRHQASHDNLTGLANRQRIEQQVEHALETAQQASRQVGLLFVDLDNFKVINDSLGHAAGDELLQQVAARIKDNTRSPDIVARLGGDEFLILMSDVTTTEAAIVAAERVVESLRTPFVLNGTDLVSVSCSVGIACTPEHGVDYGTLVRRADAAMYQAKAQGRNCVAVFANAPADGAAIAG